MKQTLRIAIVVSFACAAVTAFSNFAQAQKVDVAFGISTVEAPAANSTGPSLTGGTYPGFSGDVLFWHNFGIGGEIYWRATQSIYPAFSGPVPYRPLFLDFDGVYSPKLARHAYLELSAGIGAVDTRIYCQDCYNGYTNYSTDKHFMGDFGAGLKLYPKGGFFIRPEAKVYLVNNNQLFSSSYATRVGASIGYNFGGGH
ncbi:MAG: hypothetical protein WCA13_18415 [Terriglobales bacterium]